MMKFFKPVFIRFTLFALSALALSACAEGVESSQNMEQSSANTFCDEAQSILLVSSVHAQGADHSSFAICISDQKAELQVAETQNSLLVSDVLLRFYLPELSYEEILADLKSIGLTNSGDAVDYSNFGSCYSSQTIEISGVHTGEAYSRQASCGISDELSYETAVVGDFDAAVDLIKLQVPNLNEILDLTTGLPYPTELTE